MNGGHHPCLRRFPRVRGAPFAPLSGAALSGKQTSHKQAGCSLVRSAVRAAVVEVVVVGRSLTGRWTGRGLERDDWGVGGRFGAGRELGPGRGAVRLGQAVGGRYCITATANGLVTVGGVNWCSRIFSERGSKLLWSTMDHVRISRPKLDR